MFYQLCYTRGTVLPCFLTLQGGDANTLDLVSSPSAVVAKLQRRVRFFNKPLQTWHESSEDLGSAVWWPAVSVQSTANVRHLEGEIKLTKDLRPTTSIGHFSITVSFPFA